jgi:hypothetical protein
VLGNKITCGTIIIREMPSAGGFTVSSLYIPQNTTKINTTRHHLHVTNTERNNNQSHRLENQKDNSI